jgi:hypothetical protein
MRTARGFLPRAQRPLQSREGERLLVVARHARLGTRPPWTSDERASVDLAAIAVSGRSERGRPDRHASSRSSPSLATDRN